MALAQISGLKTTEVVIAGIRIEGWAENENAIEFASVDLTAVKTGATGLKTYGRTGHMGGQVTIRVAANSVTEDSMRQIVNGIKFGDLNQVFSGTVLYESGDFVNMRNGTLITAPQGYNQGNGAPADREYVFEFEEIL